jgi:hypothetical protein
MSFIRGWTDKEGEPLGYQEMGAFINPKNDDEWSTLPYNKEQKSAHKAYQRVRLIFKKITSHLDRTNRSIKEELLLIKNKKSTLPKYCRDWLSS